MASSMKREQPTDAFHSPEAKKAKFVQEELSEPPVRPPNRVLLNPADCDLDFNVDGDGLHGSALYEEGFAYCWSGARANVGINGGRYCFGCKVVAAQPVDMVDTPLDQQHVCRLGISRGDDPVGNLGETVHSYGFGGTGKFSYAGIFSDYGENFKVGDTIVCCVDLESRPMASIGFSKNGKWLGIANEFDAGPTGLGVVDSPTKRLRWESAIFPHVLLKNVIVQLQFSIKDGLVPQEGYRPWASAIEDGKMILGPTFSNQSDCELIMMVGLPASGKSTWAEKLVKMHPEKRYILLGTNLALDQMKVPGLLRKRNYGERFDLLMDRATKIFNALLSRASKMPCNFIIDQTNVYKSARKRKLKPFADYQKIAVVVFPRPEELKFRADKRFEEMGKEVPAEAVNEMLANYTLPMSKDMPLTDEYFDEVRFPELSRVESQRCLDEMKANLNLKEVSPFSREGSFQSYNSRLLQHSHQTFNHRAPLQNQGNLLGFGGNWQNSYSSQHPMAPPVSYNSSCSLYPGEHHHYGNNNNENRFAAHGSMNQLYQNYGVGDTGSYAGGEGRNLLPGAVASSNTSQMIQPYPRMVAFPYNTGDVCASQPTGAPPDLLATKQPNYGSTTSALYGPPNAATMPMPIYGNFPGGTMQFRGYAPPPPPPPPRPGN